MYQGKYSSKDAAPKAAKTGTPAPKTPKSRPDASPVNEVTQVSQTPARRKAAAEDTRVSNTPVRKTPAPKKKRGKKPLTKGTMAFYIVYLVLILAFFIAMGFAMNALRNWLLDFEASQPDSKAQEVFDSYFANPDWETLYSVGHVKGATFPDAAAYAAYMRETTAGSQITMVETSAGLSGGKKFVIRAAFSGDKYYDLATFTLVDKKEEGSLISNWQLTDVTLLTWNEQKPTIKTYHCTFIVDPSCTVSVDGKVLDESYVQRTVTTTAESYLPNGLHGYRLNELYVDGLLKEPQIQVTDANGNPVEMVYDEATCTYTQPITAPTMGDSERNTVLNAAKTYCKYMIGATGKADLKNAFDESTSIYYTITTNTTWMQNYKGYDFGTAKITGFYRYSESLYSARVQMALNVTRKDGTVKVYELNNTFILQKQGSSWKVIEMTNEDIQTQIEKVRLTFKNGETVIESMMIDTSAKRLTLPAVAAPEGQVFKGWFTQTAMENGDTTMDLIFPPTATGSISLPEDQKLNPMTLYALFGAAEEG